MAYQEMIEILRRVEGHLAKISIAVTDQAPPPIDPGLSYTRRQAARMLGVSVWLIDAARKEGLLREAEKLGQRDVRLIGESLLRFQHERQAKGRAEIQKI